MKLKIDRLTSRDVKTSRGMSKSLSLQAGGTWYSAWAGNWNEGWAVNDTIEVPDDRIRKTEKGDKTYWNIEAPPKGQETLSKASKPADNDRVLKGLTEIWKAVADLKKEVADLHKEVRSLRGDVGAIPL